MWILVFSFGSMAAAVVYFSLSKQANMEYANK